MHKGICPPPINKRKTVLGNKLCFYFSLFLFFPYCLNQAFFRILPFSLQTVSLVLECSLGCQATSFSLFRFSGKNVAHPFTLSPWHEFEHTFKTRVIRHYQVKQQWWRIKHQPSSLHYSTFRAESWRKPFGTVFFIQCEWVWTGYWILAQQ